MTSIKPIDNSNHAVENVIKNNDVKIQRECQKYQLEFLIQLAKSVEIKTEYKENKPHKLV